MIKETFDTLFKENDLVNDFQLHNFIVETMLPNKNSIPMLYRYSPANYYNIRNLETQTLVLSNAGTMNDVFEGLACEIDDNIIDSLDSYYNIALLKSFTENKNDLLMWAHYAENYSGICVEYDFSKLSDEILFHLFPVYYSQKRFSKQELKYIVSSYHDFKRTQEDNVDPIDTTWLKDLLYLFLVKPECWSYEKEWRIIATYPHVTDKADVMNDEENAEFYNISKMISVKDCITAVYLGVKMKSDIKHHISEICNEKLKGVKLYSTKLSIDSYRLECELYKNNGV